MNSDVEEFAKNLIEAVRDRAVDSFDGILVRNMNSETTRKYVEEFGENMESSIRNVIPDIVDTTIFYLLKAIDNQDIALFYGKQNAELVDLEADGMGELAGNYVADDADGWRQRFSRSRVL